MDPAPSQDDLGKMYAPDYHDAHYFRGEESRVHLFELLEHRAPTRSLLDYGCGDGRFVRFATRRGWRCVGAEFDHGLIERLRAAEPEAEHLTIAELEGRRDERYGVIHLADVFEHLVEPMPVMRDLVSRLEPGGLLFVEGPIERNASLGRVALDVYFRFLKRGEGCHAPLHLLFTNRSNQRRALESLGVRDVLRFEVTDTGWPMPRDRTEIRSRLDLIKYGVGRASVGLSRVVPGSGNRFLFIGVV